VQLHICIRGHALKNAAVKCPTRRWSLQRQDPRGRILRSCSSLHCLQRALKNRRLSRHVRWHALHYYTANRRQNYYYYNETIMHHNAYAKHTTYNNNIDERLYRGRISYKQSFWRHSLSAVYSCCIGIICGAPMLKYLVLCIQYIRVQLLFYSWYYPQYLYIYI